MWAFGNRSAPGRRPLKRLIVNGDDFGESARVNRGILRAHREGILTSSSLMVAGAGAIEAADMARAHPELDVGLHLVVCQGGSLLGAARLRGLVDSGGNFGTQPVLAGLRYFFDPRVIGPMRDECRAQLERHFELVGYCNHINGHLNFHLHPTLIDILVPLAVEYQVPCLRLLREPVLTTIGLSPEHAARKLVEAAIFKLLTLRAKRAMDRAGLRATDRLYGFHQSGHLSPGYLGEVIRALPEDSLTELYFHPAALEGAGPPDAAAREVEFLTDGVLAGLIRAQNIVLTTYREVAGRRPKATAGNAAIHRGGAIG